MKNLLTALTIVLMAMCVHCMSVSAEVGDIAGQYYSTDIHTILNGNEIDSINIGGQTLINAEDMEYYYFSVNWDGEARQLDINKTSDETSGKPPVIKKSNYPSGMILGNYYETDIVTRLDGTPVTAYNTGGKTYILATDMRNSGYIVDWSEIERRVTITNPGITI